MRFSWRIIFIFLALNLILIVVLVWSVLWPFEFPKRDFLEDLKQPKIAQIPSSSETLKMPQAPALAEVKKVAKKIEKAIIEPKVLTPPPLRVQLEAPAANLTVEGVTFWTNAYRAEQGASLLGRNNLLDQVAAQKLNDMFSQQYFEHVNPQGVGVGDLVKNIGYKFIVVGENLALGNFHDDQTLVDAWMASPGHRANILNPKFREIGVAVGQGVFEGHTSWLAVQTFATAESACPGVDSNLADKIELANAEIKTLGVEADKAKIEINKLSNERDILYNSAERQINDGEALVAEGNGKIEQGNQIYRDTRSREQAEPYWSEGDALQKQGQEKVNAGLAYNSQIQQMTAELKEKIDTYNGLISKIKKAQEDAASLVAAYNIQVEAHNECVKEF